MHNLSPEMGVKPEEVETIIPEIVEKLKREYNPLKIILFGSYAYGNPTKDSDIDDLEVAKILLSEEEYRCSSLSYPSSS